MKGTLALSGALLCREANFCSVFIEHGEVFNPGILPSTFSGDIAFGRPIHGYKVAVLFDCDG